MRRRVLASVGVKALPYDAEVEYLESHQSHDALIDCGLVHKNNIEFLCRFLLLDDSSVRANRHIFSKSYSASGLGYYFKSSGVSSIEASGNYINVNKVDFSSPDIWSVIRAEGSLLSIKRDDSEQAGFIYDTGRPIFSTNDTSIRLFGASVVTNTYNSRCRISEFRLASDEGSINLIPVRFTNENGVSEGAMYDSVSGQLFRNAGTGAFIVGPDVVSSRGGGTKCLTSSSRSWWRSRASQHTSHRWEVAA